MDNSSRLVIVVDDDPTVRRTIESMAHALGCEVIAYESASALFDGYDPADKREKCLLLDYLLPGMNGLNVIELLNDRMIAVPVVLITGKLEPDVAVSAMRGGAVNCVQKPFTLVQFQTVIEDAFGSIANVRKIHEARAHHVRFDRLTNQEKAIVKMAADGYPNKQIAAHLSLSIKTVEKYRRRAYATLNVDSTARMARAVTLHSMHNMFQQSAKRLEEVAPPTM